MVKRRLPIKLTFLVRRRRWKVRSDQFEGALCVQI